MIWVSIVRAYEWLQSKQVRKLWKKKKRFFILFCQISQSLFLKFISGQGKLMMLWRRLCANREHNILEWHGCSIAQWRHFLMHSPPQNRIKKHLYKPFRPNGIALSNRKLQQKHNVTLSIVQQRVMLALQKRNNFRLLLPLLLLESLLWSMRSNWNQYEHHCMLSSIKY